jgi:hypothetical protein
MFLQQSFYHGKSRPRKRRKRLWRISMTCLLRHSWWSCRWQELSNLDRPHAMYSGALFTKLSLVKTTASSHWNSAHHMMRLCLSGFWGARLKGLTYNNSSGRMRLLLYARYARNASAKKQKLRQLCLSDMRWIDMLRNSTSSQARQSEE